MADKDSGGIATEARRTSAFILGDPTRIDFRSFGAKPAMRTILTPQSPSTEAVKAVAEAPPIELPVNPAVTPDGLADPIAAPVTIIAPPAPASKFEVAQSASLGVPFQNDIVSEAVAPQDDLLARRDDEEIQPDQDDLDEIVPRFFSPRAILGQRGVVLLLVGMASLVLLFAFTEVVALLNQVRSLPGLLQPIAYAVVFVLSAAVLATCGRVIWLYIRLKQSPRVSVRALGTLRARAVLRRQALEGLSSAEKSLQEFLLRYPLASKADEKRLMKLGFTGGEVLKLIEARENLLIAPRGSAVGWIDQFNRQFLQDLDAVARRRVRRYTKMVGFKTAAVPNGFLDTLIVLINAYLLVGDLCVIYNVRAGGWGTFSIMAHIFVNAFAAGKLDEWSGAAADQTAAALTHHGTGLMANAVKGVTKVAARAADGYINALLISRLGNATIYHLRPLVEPAGRA